MELKQAVEILKNYKEDRLPLFIDVRVFYEAIDTVLKELDKQKQVTSEPTDNNTEKIEELDVKTLSNIFISNDNFNKMVAFSTTLHKLNEVIRYINRRAENE